MDTRHTSARVVRCAVALTLLTFAVMAVAQPVTPAAPQRVTMSLDQDLITFVKWAVGIGGFILVAFGGFVVWFFGVDVAQTRKAMLDAREDIAKRLDAIRSDHQILRELKERLQKLGAELVDEIEKARTAAGPPAAPAPGQDTEASGREQSGPLTEAWDLEEKKRDRIRVMLASSEFEWSTIGTIQKKTKLSPEEIERIARNDPLVQIGQGRQGATLLRLKEFNFPQIGAAYRAMAKPGSLAEEAFQAALWEHAQQGKRPTGKLFGE